MANIVGLGTGNAVVYSILSTSFVVTQVDSTGFIVTNGFGTVIVAGSGFAVTELGNGQYSVTGTITDVAYYDGASPGLPGTSSQYWEGLNVSLGDLLSTLAAHDQTAFNNLFFGSNDTFTYVGLPGANTYLNGYGGNDVFNFAGWISNSSQDIGVDGGSGSDTLNITGGIPAFGNSINFNIANVEIVNLGAGSDYTINASTTGLVSSGNTVTINGSALGTSNNLVFTLSDDFGPFAGNLVLTGGAGDDVFHLNLFRMGSGSVAFIGNGGSDTVSFYTSNYTAAVTVNLGVSGLQSLGSFWGPASFSGIENLIGTTNNDTLTGDANDNILNGNGGSDTLNGGVGFDTAVFGLQRSAYTITHSGGTTTVSSPFDGTTTTLTGVERGQFSDQTVTISGPAVTTQNTRVIAG
jgi:hypothetical protein